MPLLSEVESPSELDGTIFENKYYAPGNGKTDLDRDIIKTETDKDATIIANDYAHAVDLIKKEHRQKFRDSPLARHTPKIITHPVKGNLLILGRPRTFNEYTSYAATYLYYVA